MEYIIVLIILVGVVIYLVNDNDEPDEEFNAWINGEINDRY